MTRILTKEVEEVGAYTSASPCEVLVIVFMHTQYYQLNIHMTQDLTCEVLTQVLVVFDIEDALCQQYHIAN